MVVNPSGTLLFRPAPENGREAGRRLMGVYGLVMAMKGIPGEHQYLCEARFNKEGARFRIDTAEGVRPPSTHTPTPLQQLGDLATAPIWKTDVTRPGVGLAFLRKTAIPAPVAGRELYLVACVLSVDAASSPQQDALIDLRFGVSVGDPTPHQAGMGGTPDQALNQPFFLNYDGERYAVASTLAPEGQAVMRSIRDVCLKPDAERSLADRDQIASWKRDPDLGFVVSTYEQPSDPHFLHYARAMADQQLPTTRLLSEHDLKSHEQLSARVLRTVMNDNQPAMALA